MILGCSSQASFRQQCPPPLYPVVAPPYFSFSPLLPTQEISPPLLSVVFSSCQRLLTRANDHLHESRLPSLLSTTSPLCMSLALVVLPAPPNLKRGVSTSCFSGESHTLSLVLRTWDPIGALFCYSPRTESSFLEAARLPVLHVSFGTPTIVRPPPPLTSGTLLRPCLSPNFRPPCFLYCLNSAN